MARSDLRQICHLEAYYHRVPPPRRRPLPYESLRCSTRVANGCIRASVLYLGGVRVRSSHDCGMSRRRYHLPQTLKLVQSRARLRRPYAASAAMAIYEIAARHLTPRPQGHEHNAKLNAPHGTPSSIIDGDGVQPRKIEPIQPGRASVGTAKLIVADDETKAAISLAALPHKRPATERGTEKHRTATSLSHRCSHPAGVPT